jgi:hypothetical protein
LKFASAFACGALLANATAYFEPNRGQCAGQVPFLARTVSGTASAGPTALQLLHADRSSTAIAFEGASKQAPAKPEQALPGVSHYARGRDPARWIWDVPHYAVLRYQQVYPGIDLVYRFSNGNIEFDFVLEAGADPARIRLRIPRGYSLDNSGAIAGKGTLLRPPVAWQIIAGRRVPVSARFAVHRHRVYFRLDDYDRRLPLTIDPVVQFTTFLGGSGNDVGKFVVAGKDGAIYVAGDTSSADFPASLPPEYPVVRPGTLFEQTVFVARLKADGSALDWSLFVGGTARQSIIALKQDARGSLYLFGSTTSPNFPVTPGALHTTIHPSMNDLFLVRLDALTGHIQASTLLDVPIYPAPGDMGAHLAVDEYGGTYVSGFRLSEDSFTPTSGALETTPPEWFGHYFVLRLNASMSALIYATYWSIGSISVLEADGAGGLWIAGSVPRLFRGYVPPPFPALHALPEVNQSPTSSPYQAYIARLNSTGSALISATLLHGDAYTSGISDLKIGPDRNIYVAGWGAGSNFPEIQPLVIDPLSSGSPDPLGKITSTLFFAKLAADGTRILQSTRFGETPNTGLNPNVH